MHPTHFRDHRATKVDNIIEEIYNSEKGVIDGKGSNQSQNGSGSTRNLGEQSSSNPKQEIYESKNEGLEGTENNILSREMDSDISSTDERGKTTSNSNRPISERIIEAKDDLNSIDKIVADVAENDVETSGTGFTTLVSRVQLSHTSSQVSTLSQLLIL